MISLRNRLVGAATIWIAFGMIASGVALSAVFRDFVTRGFDDELHVHLDELQRLAVVDGPSIRLERPISDPRYDVSNSGYYWEIQTGGQTLARSPSLSGPTLHTPQDGLKDVGVRRHEITGPTGDLLIAEVLRWPSPDLPPIRYLIGTDRRHLEHVLGDFNTTLAFALTILGGLMVLAATVLILFAMHPFIQLRRALGVVRAGNANQLPGRFPLEVQPLIDDLNSLLSSTSDLIQKARTQAGNMAHGLKGPLSVLADEAYQLQGAGRLNEAKTVLEQCRKMQTHIDYQIARTRAVALRKTPGVVSSLNQTLADVTSALARLYRDKAVEFKVDIKEQIKVCCDSEDLSEMLANIIDNACKHTASLVQITIHHSHSLGLIDVIVEDNGPGLPVEAYDIVFRVGEQWDTQKPGSGLGLAIVKDLAGLYGGDVALGRSPLGGVAVTLRLPSAALPA
ncbi:MAG: HAMP domain-containing sensor histidine kinase [Hyphomicrobium sp.]|jgi:signal transduction histidine kinase